MACTHVCLDFLELLSQNRRSPMLHWRSVPTETFKAHRKRNGWFHSKLETHSSRVRLRTSNEWQDKSFLFVRPFRLLLLLIRLNWCRWSLIRKKYHPGINHSCRPPLHFNWTYQWKVQMKMKRSLPVLLLFTRVDDTPFSIIPIASSTWRRTDEKRLNIFCPCLSLWPVICSDSSPLICWRLFQVDLIEMCNWSRVGWNHAVIMEDLSAPLTMNCFSPDRYLSHSCRMFSSSCEWTIIDRPSFFKIGCVRRRRTRETFGPYHYRLESEIYHSSCPLGRLLDHQK